MSALPDPRLLHADDSLLVIDKPAGLPAVPGRAAGLQDCAASRLQGRFADARVVHRLDMATSGLMLFARGPEAQRALSAAFEQRRVDKRYVAVVQGLLREDQGRIDLPLAADWPNRPRQRVDAEGGRAATTFWRVLDRDQRAQTTRLELQPLTGRSHQLRVHLLALGHPILGDALYGAAGTQAPRLLLHACALALAHPADARPCRFESPSPF